MSIFAPDAPAAAAIPVEQQPAAVAQVDPPAPAPAAQETGAETDTENPDKPRDEKGRFTASKERIERQISELTARKHAEKRELEMLQQQTAALRQQYQATQQVDPNDLNASEMARTQQAVIGVQHGLAQQQATQVEHRLAETRQATFMAKVDAARERLPDIDTTLATFARLPVSDIAADLIAESDRSVEIANYLGRNPNEAYRIARLHPAYQGAEIARIEARVAAQPVKRISQAPAPVQTVSGGAGNPGVDLSSLSMADYIKARQAQS
jgi:hypothetical protein